MKLLDSNIIIYSAKDNFSYLRLLFYEENIFVSEITRLEVLGFHSITREQEEYFSAIFSCIRVLPITSETINQAIVFRKKNNLSVGDEIISTTAFLNNLILYTNNDDDYKGIEEIKIFNPILDHL